MREAKVCNSSQDTRKTVCKSGFFTKLADPPATLNPDTDSLSSVPVKTLGWLEVRVLLAPLPILLLLQLGLLRLGDLLELLLLRLGPGQVRGGEFGDRRPTPLVSYF